MNLGTIWLGIRGDTKPVRADLDKLKKKAVADAEVIERRTSKALSSLTKYWKLYALAATAALGLVARSFISAASTAENYAVRLKILLGSVTEGNKLFRAMADFASEVSFQYQEIMGGATALAGVMRGGTEEIKSWMPMIADLAAAAGMGIQETVGQVIRMYSAGAAAADMFRERGILAMLGFQAGVKYSAEETRKIMFEAWESNTSKFRDAAKELAKTWDGLMSMLSDKWFQFRTLVMDAGVYDALKDALGDINDQFERWIKNNREMIAQDIPKYVDKVKTSIEGIVKMYNALPVAAIGAGLVMAIIFKSSAQLAILVAGIVHVVTNLDDLRWSLNEIGRIGTVGAVPKIIPSWGDVKKAADQIKGLWSTISGGKVIIDGTAASLIAADEAIAKLNKRIDALLVEQRELNEQYMKGDLGASKWIFKLRVVGKEIARLEELIAGYREELKKWAEGFVVPTLPEVVVKPKLPEQYWEDPIKEFERQWGRQIRDLPPIPDQYWEDPIKEFKRQWGAMVRDLPAIPDKYVEDPIKEFERQWSRQVLDLPSIPDKYFEDPIKEFERMWGDMVRGLPEIEVDWEEIGRRIAIGAQMVEAVGRARDPESAADRFLNILARKIGGFWGGIVQAIRLVFRGIAADFIEMIPDMISVIIKGLGKNLPRMLKDLVPSIFDAILKALPTLIRGIAAQIPYFIEEIISHVPRMIDSIIAEVPKITAAIIECVVAVFNWIAKRVPELIEEWWGEIIDWFGQWSIADIFKTDPGKWSIDDIFKTDPGLWSIADFFKTDPSKWSIEDVFKTDPSKWSIDDLFETDITKWSIEDIFKTDITKWSISDLFKTDPGKWSISDIINIDLPDVGFDFSDWWDTYGPGAWIPTSLKDWWDEDGPGSWNLSDFLTYPISILDVFIPASILDIFTGGGDGGGGGLGGACTPLTPWNCFHQGGEVPRAHAGILARDEVPIIVQTGERVLSREQNRAYETGALGGEQGGGDIHIHLEIDGAEIGHAVFPRLEFDQEAINHVRGTI